MKAQNNNRLAKKTVFVYKSNKDQNGFNTDPSTVTAQSIVITFICNK